MNPTRLQGFTPDEFERLCLELSQQVLGAESVARRGGISDPDQGIDIEATVSSKIVGIQCKTGKVTVAVLRAALRALIGYPHRLDRFILMCAQHPMPAAIDEFRSWSSRSETIAGPIPVAEIWDPDRIAAELDSYPEIIRHLAEETRGAAFAVPVARLASFVGREKELDTLADRLRQDLPGQRPLLIFGMGGIGKTSLAVEFAYKQRHSFPGGVFWLNGQEDLVAQCARLATLNGAATSDVQEIAAARAFLNSLRQGPPSLVILDDLDRPGLLHEPLVNGLSLAECGCQILATSRFVGLAAGGVSRLDLGTVSPKDALYLLASTSNRPTLVQAVSSESQLAMQLCQTLGYLPLAVQIAGSYLALHPEIGIAAYLKTLNARGSAVSLDESEAGALHFAQFTLLANVLNSNRISLVQRRTGASAEKRGIHIGDGVLSLLAPGIKEKNEADMRERRPKNRGCHEHGPYPSPPGEGGREAAGWGGFNAMSASRIVSRTPSSSRSTSAFEKRNIL